MNLARRACRSGMKMDVRLIDKQDIVLAGFRFSCECEEFNAQRDQLRFTTADFFWRRLRTS